MSKSSRYRDELDGVLLAGRYRVRSRIGTGGMGTVYEAVQEDLRRLVAIKVLHPELAARQVLVERLRREALAAAALGHPHIVQVTDFQVSADEPPFLVMEHLTGQSLHDAIRDAWPDPFPIHRLIRIALQVLSALAAAHDAQVVHRDIKPANVFLLQQAAVGDLVKVLDFGVAKHLTDTADEPITSRGSVIGTLSFMAPEQALGREVDGRADLYAVAACLYFGLTCRLPVPADAIRRIDAIASQQPLPIATFRPDLARPLADAVMRGLAKDPANRFATATEMSEALAAGLEMQGAPGARPASAGLETLPASKTPPTPPLATVQTRPPRPVLTGDERLRMWVVLVREARDVGPADGPDTTRSVPLLPEPLPIAGESAETAELPTELSGPIADVLRAAAANRSGRIAKLSDGSLALGLAGGTSAVDDAESAALCALSVRAVAPHAQIALVAGRAELGSALAGPDALARAAALLEQPAGADADLAPPPIRLDELTVTLLESRFEIDNDALGRALRGRRESVRTLLGRPSPCVGRSAELSQLSGVFSQCISEPMSRAVLITADAGFGKSRLRQEFVSLIAERSASAAQAEQPNSAAGPLSPVARSAPRPEIWIGRGEPMGAGSTFRLLAQAVTGAAGIFDNDPLPVRRRKLTTRVARHVAESERERVTAFLGEMVGTPFSDDARIQLRAARRDPTLMHDHIRRAWEDFVAAECAVRPVLVVLEDLHWGDAPSVALVDAALRTAREKPLMVVAFARPEVHTIFPGLWAHRDLQTMSLGGLTRRTATELVRMYLGPSATAETVERVVERAGGHPFYLEELVRSVADGTGGALPDTVLAMVESRLNALEPGARRVLRAASVFGTRFWSGGVHALVGDGGLGDAAPSDLDREADEWLEQLCQHEIVSVQNKSQFPNQRTYSFRHALLRDAAYATFTEADRVLGHRLAGEWLEVAGERDACVMAEHFEIGDDRERAARWYRRACEQALDGNDLEAVIAHARAAVRCGAFGETLGVVRLLQGEAHQWRNEYAAAVACADEALKRLPMGGAHWLSALGLTVRGTQAREDPGRLAHIAEQLLDVKPDSATAPAWVTTAAILIPAVLGTGWFEIADELMQGMDRQEASVAGDAGALAWMGNARSWVVMYRGDPAACLALDQEVVRKFEEVGDVRNVCLQRVSIAYDMIQLGASAETERELFDIIALAESLGLKRVCGIAKQHRGLVLAHLGRFDEAIALATDGVAMVQSGTRFQGGSRLTLALILTLAGRLDEAEIEARSAVTLLEPAPLRGPALAALATVLLRRGAGGEALEQATEAMGCLRGGSGVEEGEAQIRLVHAEALWHAGRLDEALEAILAARDRLLQRADQISDRVWRQSFLVKVPEHARTLALVDEWLHPPVAKQPA